MQINNRLSSDIIVLQIIISTLLIFYYPVFSIYTIYAIYLNSVIVVLTIILNRRIQKWTFVFLVISLIYMFISISINNGGFGSILTYAVSMLALEMVCTLDFSEKQEKTLHWFMALVILLLVFASIKYTVNFKYYEYNDVNPNTIGEWVLYAFCIYICTTKTTKKRRAIVNLVFLAVAITTLMNVESRGCLIALISFCVLTILPKKLFKSRFVIILVCIITALGIAFPFFYLGLYSRGFDLTFLNKSLFTGRQGLWIRALGYFSQTPSGWYVGLGSKIELWDAATNVHNSYFGMIINFGIVGMILYFVFIARFVLKVARYCNYDKEIKNWFCMFVSTNLVLGFTETSIFWSVIFILANLGLGRAYNLCLQYENGELQA